MRLGKRTYPVRIEAGAIRGGGAAALIAGRAPSDHYVVITHPRLDHIADRPAAALRELGARVTPIRVPVGERSKSPARLLAVWRELQHAGADRDAVIVAVGGGVVGDLAGFAAATWLRGVRLVQIPTTLLAMVDSAIGGKTAVDLPGGKNLVGAFHQPAAVIVDPEALATLPTPELRSGLAEVVKYGAIADEPFFREVANGMSALLRRAPGPTFMAIDRSCAIKIGVVESDETEHGMRANLNFGHTLGHAIEAATGYRTYRHGYAVAMGMTAAALVGEELGVTPSTVTGRLRDALRAAGLPSAWPGSVDAGDAVGLARADKKARGGAITMVLLEELGRCRVVRDVPERAIHAAIRRASA